MTPYEILLSESQERMLIVARAGAEDEVLEIFAKWDLDAVVIGTVTDDGLLRVRAGGAGGRRPADRAAGARRAGLRAAVRAAADLDELQRLDLGQLPPPGDYSQTLLRLLDSPNIASKRWVFRQYDYAGRQQHRRRPGLRRRRAAHQGHATRRSR